MANRLGAAAPFQQTSQYAIVPVRNLTFVTSAVASGPFAQQRVTVLRDELRLPNGALVYQHWDMALSTPYVSLRCVGCRNALLRPSNAYALKMSVEHRWIWAACCSACSIVDDDDPLAEVAEPRSCAETAVAAGK